MVVVIAGVRGVWTARCWGGRLEGYGVLRLLGVGGWSVGLLRSCIGGLAVCGVWVVGKKLSYEVRIHDGLLGWRC